MEASLKKTSFFNIKFLFKSEITFFLFGLPLPVPTRLKYWFWLYVYKVILYEFPKWWSPKLQKQKHSEIHSTRRLQFVNVFVCVNVYVWLFVSKICNQEKRETLLFCSHHNANATLTSRTSRHFVLSFVVDRVCPKEKVENWDRLVDCCCCVCKVQKKSRECIILSSSYPSIFIHPHTTLLFLQLHCSLIRFACIAFALFWII